MLDIQPQTRLNDYVIINKLSSYGKNAIFKAYIPRENEEYNDTTKCYIIKVIQYETAEEQAAYKNEADVLDLFKDIPTIIKYNETFILKNEITGDKRYIFEVMDFYPYIDLYDYHLEHINDPVDPDQIRSIAYQAFKIVSIIHKENVIHHDVKPGNFLIESLNPFTIKITDFEFAVRLDENGKTQQHLGTCFYMAPELLDCQLHDKSVDIWALGIMIYELTAKKKPFNLRQEQPQRFIIALKLKKVPLTFGENFKDPLLIDLLSKMLQHEADKRITADEALNHPYFDGFKNL